MQSWTVGCKIGLHASPAVRNSAFLVSAVAVTQSLFPQILSNHEVVDLWSGSKGLLTFLGSLYKEVAKTTSGTLMYRFKRHRQKNIFFLRKTLSSTQNVEFYLRNLQITAFSILMACFMECKLKKISIDSWWCVNAVIIETVEALETRYSIILSGSNVISLNQSLCPCHFTRYNR